MMPVGRLADAIGARHAAEVVLVSGGPDGWQSLTAGDLLAVRPSPLLCAPRGAAVSVLSAHALLRLLAALDGRAERLLLLSPQLPAEGVAALMRRAELDRLVTDRGDLGGVPELRLDPAAALDPEGPAARGQETGWVMTTSGTTGLPKMVRHRLTGLTRALRPARVGGAAPVWGLLYEPTRFAGLQVVLQALTGGGRLVVPDPAAPMAERLAGMAARGVTHLSATPTLWRRILMEPGAASLPLTHVTLGGEIADAPVLAALAARWPQARIRHIYAATELGVGFSVGDGRPGFPARWLNEPPGEVALSLREGMLWLRPPGPLPASVGGAGPAPDADGYLPSGDRMRREGDRLLFIGRDSSAVNIGGTKIQPEEIEHLLHAHPAIAAARIAVRASPITGNLLTLSVVPADPEADPAALRREISLYCRTHLPREAMPARIVIERDLTLTAAGKTPRS